jgi:hypothetical protein
MHIRFTYHANYRREERNISVEKIKEVICHPDMIEIKRGGKLLHVKRFETKTITVVFVVSRGYYIIISIF